MKNPASLRTIIRFTDPLKPYALACLIIGAKGLIAFTPVSQAGPAPVHAGTAVEHKPDLVSDHPSTLKNSVTKVPSSKNLKPMTNSIPTGYDYHIVSPTNHAGLT